MAEEGDRECNAGTDVLSQSQTQGQVQPEVHYQWAEITDSFKTACSWLKLGELLHDANFGLFEAMSAIEMMDPKMDAGMLCNQAKHKVLNLQQAIQAGKLKISDVKMPELVGVIDDTLACLVTWLEGHSLAQTVFTNLYLHDPDVIQDKPLKAFCVCMLKTVDLLRDKINRAGVFEEEDFQPMTYGFKMASDTTDARTLSVMKEVEDDLNRIVKMTRSKAGEERDSLIEQEHKESLAVYSRIKFCRLFFLALLGLSKEKCQGVPEAQKYLKQMSELLTAMKKSIDLGVKPDSQDEHAQDYPTIMGFEPLVNQRLLPPTFPRYTKIKQRGETLDYLEQLIGRLLSVCSVMELSSLHHVLVERHLKILNLVLQEFFLEFSKPSPCVLSRSLLQLLYLPRNRRAFGNNSLVDVLRDTIRNFIMPPALMPRGYLSGNSQAKEYVDAFLTHAMRPVTAIFQITGHNRARQRDKWGHLLEDMVTLQDEADKVDAFLYQMLVKQDPNRQHLACFGTWVLYHTLQIMIHYTLAGFELELYATHEYHYVYWYLYECLYSWLISTLSRADSLLHEQESLLEQQKGRGAKKNKKKKKPRPHAREIHLAQAAQSLCGGCYKAVVGFTLDGKLKQPRFEFDTEEVRYNHRFAPFGNLVTPPPVQYAQFKEMSKPQFPFGSVDYYEEALKCFQQAKAIYETISNPNEEVQTLLKVAKTNFVVMKLLLGGHKKDSQIPPEFDFSTHVVFPVIKLV